MSETIPSELKHTIRDLRVRAGLSQYEACDKLGITPPTLRKWESDSSNLSLRKLEAITNLYKVPVEYIYIGPEDFYKKN